MILYGDFMKALILITSILFTVFSPLQSRVIRWENPVRYASGMPDSSKTVVVIVIASADYPGPHLDPRCYRTITENLVSNFTTTFLEAKPDWNVLILPTILYPAPGAPGIPVESSSSLSSLYDTLIATFRELHMAGCDSVIVIDYRFRSDTQAAVRQAIRFSSRKWGMNVIQPIASIIFDDSFRVEFAGASGDPQLINYLTHDIQGGLVDSSIVAAADPSLIDLSVASNLPPFPMTVGKLEVELSFGATLASLGATNGYIGYPNLASPEYGVRLIEMITKRLTVAAIRLANKDAEIVRDTRSIYSSMPMQGSRYLFAYPMPIGSGYDGLIPAVQVLAQSTGNIGFASLLGVGFESGRFISKTRLVIGDFFFNPLEAFVDFNTVCGLNSVTPGIRFYFGYASPDLAKKPIDRLTIFYNIQTAIPQTNRGIYMTSGRMDSIVLRFEHDPLIGYPFGFRETETVLHEPWSFCANYEFGSAAFGGINFELLQLEARYYYTFANKRFQLACRTYFAGNDLIYPEDSAVLPDQKKIEGNGYINFRGYASLADNLFEKILLQNVELRCWLPIKPAWIIDAYIVALGIDTGFGSQEWGDLLAADSFRADLNLSIFLKLTLLPFPLRADGAMVIEGENAFKEFNWHLGIGMAY